MATCRACQAIAQRMRGRHRLYGTRASAGWSDPAAALKVLGLPFGTSRREIKLRFYELAKQTHPDAQPTAEAAEAAAESSKMPCFVDVLDAFELLMEADEFQLGGVSADGTAPKNAARGGGSGAARQSRGASWGRSNRTKTLGEVLCERLEDEPSAALEVWGEIKDQRLQVAEGSMDSLFRACASSGVGLSVALQILREANQLELLSKPVRSAALVSLIKWCKEDKSSYETIFNEIEEQDKDPDLMETVSYANFLYSGVDGYSK